MEVAMNTEQFAQALKNLRKRKYLTQGEVAKQLNITSSAYSNYEQGTRVPDILTLKKLSIIFGVSLDVLLGDKPLSETKGIRIPVLGVIPAGTPIEAIEDVLGYEEISEDLARRGEYFALKVEGDSMLPTIKNGDIVIIKQQSDADSGQICVVMINGYDATLKEIKKEPNGIWVLPHNPNCDFKPSFYSKEDILRLPIRIIGVAIEIRRSL